MKSDNPPYSSIELGWAALAWTQFLVIVTTVHREDFHLIRSLLPTFIDTPERIFRDTTPFAGLALLLNAISLGFLALPMAGIRKDVDKSVLRAYHYHGNIVAGAGALFWLVSFIAFLIYLNPLIAGLTVGAAFLGLIWIGVAVAIKRKV